MNSNYPLWVAWLAKDTDGVWWGFEYEPNQFDRGWYENEVGRSIIISGFDANASVMPTWENSLRKVNC